MAKYLIVGGVAGGATAAARLRRLDEQAEIIMFERGEHISYANCGLPYYIGDVINEREKLLLQTPESFHARLHVDVRINNEVIAIDPKAKTVAIKNTKTGEEYKESYDKLILSPGASPINPPLKGVNQEGIFTLRNVKDTDQIKSYCQKNKTKRAVVVGAGFIGLEMAENFHHLGMQVNIIERAPQVMTPIDFEMAAGVHQHLIEKEVGLYLGQSVKSFQKSKNGILVQLDNGKEIETDIVILSIGVKPETKLAQQAGIQLAPNGGIQVNEYLLTSQNDIYAVGDAIAFPHPITGEYINSYLAGPANFQGRIVADNIVNGNKRKYKGSLSTAIAKVFDLTIATVGLNETQLKKSGIAYQSNIIHGGSHAGYYPGALNLTIKLFFSPETALVLGAQIIGYEGVDKRIDMIASIMLKSGDIYDLQEIEHAYAPPFSSAKDPVNQAGYAAQNILDKRVKTIDWKTLHQKNFNDIFLLDVRTAEEHSLGALPNSINIDVDDLRNHLDQLPKNKDIIIYCGVGLRGYVAARILMQSGLSDVYNLSGGLKIYKQAIAEQQNELISTQQEKSTKAAKPAISFNPNKMKTIEIDACGLQCPGPVLKLKKEIDKIETGDYLKQIATDPGFATDVKSWCKLTGNNLVSVEKDKGLVTAVIQKGIPESFENSKQLELPKNKTMVVFSDDLDRALASFVIANGAASTGRKVTMFFTFWGLNVIKKRQKPNAKKDFIGSMFGKMMAGHAGELSLSKMNMMGMGSKMMRKRMQSKNVDSLEDLIQSAIDSGVEMIACQMSMDVMGVNESELIDGVTIGGVASYLEAADQSNLNLFV